MNNEIELRYKDKEDRDRKARELRKIGYIVKVKTWDFTDLGRCKLYELIAIKGE